MNTVEKIRSGDEKEYTYPVKKIKGITVAAVLFFQIIYSVLFFPYLPIPGFGSLYLQLSIYFMLSIFIYATIISKWPEKLFKRAIKIKINDKGIYSWPYFIKWEDLQEVKHGFLWFRNYPRISLKVNRKKVNFWTFKSVSSNISISNTKLIYTDIIPIIRKFRPDIEIPNVVEKIINNPSKAITEQKICSISDNLKLMGVSYDGKYALFGPVGILSLPIFKILDINHNNWKTIDLQGCIFSIYDDHSFILSNPKFSVWSPTEDTGILKSTIYDFRNKKGKDIIKLFKTSSLMDQD